MNRRERRALGIKDKPATFVLTAEQVEAVRREGYMAGREDTLRKATEGYLAVFSLALRDTYGFARDRLSTVIDSCMFKLSAIGEGEAEFRDFVLTLRDETGIDMAGDGTNLTIRNLNKDRMVSTLKWGVSKEIAEGELPDGIAWSEQR